LKVKDEEVLREIGVEKRQKALDFGCGFRYARFPKQR
jgi:hypothetical protein